MLHAPAALRYGADGMSSCSEQLAHWVSALKFEDLPADVVESTKLRILDVIGLALAGLGTAFGQSVRKAAIAMESSGEGRIFGTGERVGTGTAAFVNGALAQALEFDDTHNESIVHMSSPSVAAALALAKPLNLSGKQVITAIALSNEIACRVGSVAPGQFHRRGFHPTGLFAPFGTAYLAGKLLGLTEEQLVNAAGIVGSFAAGILQCWVDGTDSKYLHSGWAAQSGIFAAFLGRAGTTGPRAVFEGRFGFMASHLPDGGTPRDFARITDGLGATWESRRSSFKPFPAAHVIHPYIDASLRLRRQHAIDPALVREIVCPVASYIVPIVCEPIGEKRRPKSDSHGRVSLQYTLAEAMYAGRLGKDAYQPSALQNPEILRLADSVAYHVDPTFPGPERFKGQVKVTLHNGAAYEAIEEHNRGSAENPMSTADLVAKFEENTAARLPPAQIKQLASAIFGLESSADASALVQLSVGN
jgi:2-methylcitrate dehydratase PrpD